MRFRPAAIALIVTTLACPAAAGEGFGPQKTISEADLRRMSAVAYTELLRQAAGKGHTYSAKSVANGYRRHLEELRLRLIGAGYTILAGEAGA